MAATSGASTKELVARLGHSSPQAALRYQHATPERDAAIAEFLDGVIQRAVIQRAVIQRAVIQRAVIQRAVIQRAVIQHARCAMNAPSQGRER